MRERQRVADLAAARFGCGSSMSNMKGLVDLGVGWIRTAIDIYPSFLRELRKAQEIDFSFLDKRVRNLQSNNILTFFVITPQKENGEWPSADDFAWVLGKIAERYDGDGVDDMPGLIYPLTNFEICNEINTELPEWSGFTDQIYLEYMRKCHRALHAANPGAKLFCGALEGPPTRGGNDTFDRLLSNGGGKYVDAISYHNYSELFMLDRTMTYLRNHNLLNKQIFITEGSFQLEYHGKDDKPSYAELSNMLVKTYAYAIAHEQVKVIIYSELQARRSYKDSLRWDCLIDVNGKRRRHYYAYKKLIEKIGKFTSSTWYKPARGAIACLFMVDNRKVYVVWGRRPTVIRLPVSRSRVRVTPVVPDPNGNFSSKVYDIEEGMVIIEVGKKAAYVEEL